MKTNINGVVEAIGEKFNGSLKVGGMWYANKRGFKNPAKKGDNVILTLEEWTSATGMKGLNISAVDVIVPTKAEVKTKKDEARPGVVEATKVLSSGRDFDAENRGKVRHGLTVALVPLIATETVSLDKAKELVTELTEFVMKG